MRSLAAFLLVLLGWLAPRAAHADQKLDWGGRINLEMLGSSKLQELTFDKEGQLEVTLQRDQTVGATVDVRATTRTRGLEVREAFIDYTPQAGRRWMIGQAKKRFGLDWDRGMEKRLTLQRGAVYRKLGSLAYVGRDSMVGYSMKQSDLATMSHDFSLHTSEGINAAGLYQLDWKLNATDLLKAYTLVHVQTFESKWIYAEAQALSYEKITDNLQLQGELFIGEDFNETEYQSRLGAGKSVYFSAFSVAALWMRPGVEPFARLGVIAHDLSELGSRSLEAVLGGRIYLQKKVVLGSEVAMLSTRTGERGADRLLLNNLSSRSHLMVALRYFF